MVEEGGVPWVVARPPTCLRGTGVRHHERRYHECRRPATGHREGRAARSPPPGSHATPRPGHPGRGRRLPRSPLRSAGRGSRHQVVRNGYLPQRTLLTGVGPVEVKQPRVQDRRPATQREKFSSAILPPYLRKTKSIEELIPWLYLKGVSSGDFSEALAALLGPQAKGLSARTVTGLRAVWAEEYPAWSKRSLAGKHYVYLWADGVYFNIRLEEDRQCILVLMGATADGKKELIALADG